MLLILLCKMTVSDKPPLMALPGLRSKYLKTLKEIVLFLKFEYCRKGKRRE